MLDLFFPIGLFQFNYFFYDFPSITNLAWHPFNARAVNVDVTTMTPTGRIAICGGTNQ